MKKTHADGTTRSWAYNGINQVQSFTNELGKIATFVHNANGNLTTVTDFGGNSEQFQYNTNDRLATWIDALGKLTTYVYDAAGSFNRRPTPPEKRPPSLATRCAGWSTSPRPDLAGASRATTKAG